MIARDLAVRLATSRVGVGLRRRIQFVSSGRYWERRYSAGGTSGAGSYGPAAAWKAEVVNAWVREHEVTSVLDLGCGDGNQLSLADYPRYLGLDRSADRRSALHSESFAADPTKSFRLVRAAAIRGSRGVVPRDHTALSMEVLFHLVEDDVFEDYMSPPVRRAERFVVVCSSDVTSGDGLRRTSATALHPMGRRAPDSVAPRRSGRAAGRGGPPLLDVPLRACQRGLSSLTAAVVGGRGCARPLGQACPPPESTPTRVWRPKAC